MDREDRAAIVGKTGPKGASGARGTRGKQGRPGQTAARSKWATDTADRVLVDFGDLRDLVAALREQVSRLQGEIFMMKEVAHRARSAHDKH